MNGFGAKFQISNFRNETADLELLQGGLGLGGGCLCGAQAHCPMYNRHFQLDFLFHYRAVVGSFKGQLFEGGAVNGPEPGLFIIAVGIVRGAKGLKGAS